MKVEGVDGDFGFWFKIFEAIIYDSVDLIFGLKLSKKGKKLSLTTPIYEIRW